MKLDIRLERPEEHHAVEVLTREAFRSFPGRDPKETDEHYLVHLLRKDPSFLPELDFVALADGKLVGNIMYTRTRVMGENNAWDTLTFGPLSVHPDHQQKGVGAALVRHSTEVARQLGHRAIFIFGHPEYYPRLGFEKAGNYGVTTATGETPDAFMVLPLYPGALDGVGGKLVLPEVYTIDREAFLEFDRRFEAE